MHKYGGIYADLDTWCLRPIDTLFKPGSRKAYVAEMGPDKDFGHNIPNAWFASAPNHPFWIFYSKCAVELLSNPQGRKSEAEQVTGPLLLKQALDTWNNIHGKSGDETLEVIKYGKVYVNDWHGWGEEDDPEMSENNLRLSSCPQKELHNEGVADQCRAALPEAVVLTFWSHSWSR